MPTYSDSVAPSAPQRRGAARWLVILAVVVLAGGGLALYVGRGVGIRDQALAAYAADDCATVTGHAATLGQQYALPGLSFVADVNPAAAACAAVGAAQGQAQAQDYAAAVAAYDTFLAAGAASPLGPRAAAERTETLFAWAAAQRDSGQYAEALKTLALLARDDAALAARADEALVQTYAAWGDADLAAGAPAEAIAHWDMIVVDYPAASMAAAAAERIIGAYAGWTSELFAAGSFRELLAVYEQELEWAEQHGDAALLSATKLGQAGAHLAWSTALQDQGNFEAAWAQNGLAVEADPEPSASAGPATLARAAQPDLLRAWAASLVAANKPDAALAKLGEARALIVPADTATLAAIDTEITQAHLAAATAAVKASRFNKALEAIDKAAQSAAADLRPAVEEQRAQALDVFARSTGDEAKAAMTNAISAICANGEFPTVPPFALADVKAQLGLNTGDGAAGYRLSTELNARSPAELHYVACATGESRLVERCAYDIGYNVERMRSSVTVVVHAVPSGKVAGTKTFSGPAPEACQFIETFSIGQSVKIKAGGPPDNADINAWLASFVD